MVIYPLGPHGPDHGRNKSRMGIPIGIIGAHGNMRMPEPNSHGADSLQIKFSRTVLACRTGKSWLFANHNLNQWWSVYRRIYASLGLNELTPLYSGFNGHVTHCKASTCTAHVVMYNICLYFKKATKYCKNERRVKSHVHIAIHDP